MIKIGLAPKALFERPIKLHYEFILLARYTKLMHLEFRVSLSNGAGGPRMRFPQNGIYPFGIRNRPEVPLGFKFSAKGLVDSKIS